MPEGAPPQGQPRPEGLWLETPCWSLRYPGWDQAPGFLYNTNGGDGWDQLPQERMQGMGSHPIYPAHPKKLATSWKMASTKSSVQTALQHPLGPTAPLPSVFKPLSSPGKKA